MEKEDSKFFLFLCLLSVHTLCSSGTQVGLLYDQRENITSLTETRTPSFLQLNKITPIQIRVSVDDDLNLLSTPQPISDVSMEEKHILPCTARKLLSRVRVRVRTRSHNTIFNPAIPSTPITFPPDSPTPTVVTVPSASNPVTTTPGNPDANPVPIPAITPVIVPSLNPITPVVPITNPVTTPAPVTMPGAQPITNPVTTYPAPTGNVPVMTPVTNPGSPPAATNAPAVPGQSSWCVAKAGASQSAIQAALDYACGIGGADCSQIQQGASCYNPVTLQNHASFAFNSYYQKNPVATSCDFGGTASIVSSNPSSGSCIFPSSSSPSSTMTTPSTPSVTIPPPVLLPPPTPITTLPPPAPPAPSLPAIGTGTGIPGSYGAPPLFLNSSIPPSGSTTIFGSDIPPSVNTSTTSTSSGFRSYIGCFTLLTSVFTGVVVLNI